MDKVTTEQKIIRAADNLFTQKGYAATKTREIADEAGVNLALLNYYFGSKENLYKSSTGEVRNAAAIIRFCRMKKFP